MAHVEKVKHKPQGFMKVEVDGFLATDSKIKDPTLAMSDAEKKKEIDKLKNENVNTLDNVINVLQQADRTADKITGGLDENTAIMKRILDKQDHINENLAKGGKILGNMEGITGGGAHADKKFEETKLKPVSPDGFPIFQSGMVKKAGKHFKDKWQKCHLMVHGNKLSIADDENAKHHQDIKISKSSYLILLADSKAPPQLQKLKDAHPGGFAVYEDSKQEIPWLFDTPNPKAQSAWVRGFQSCMEYIKLGVHDVWSDPRVQKGAQKNLKEVRKFQKKRAADDAYGKKTDEQLDVVDDLLDVLHGKAENIGKKIDEQTGLIGKMSDNTHKAREDMHNQKNQMHNIVKETEKNWI
ncbi:unnamed protein product [Amoebophrya sp. A25]|nr:unnamed protein product [Amoebophrya sp. A25]|eukprot:GSA25T00003058001.1